MRKFVFHVFLCLILFSCKSGTEESTALKKGIVYLNEFDPSSQTLELYNVGNGSVSVDGCVLSLTIEGITVNCILSRTAEIPHGGFTVVKPSGALIPSDCVMQAILKSPDGEELDRMEYASSAVTIEAGETLGRETDGAGDWVVFSSGTMGSSNVFGTVKKEGQSDYQIIVENITATKANVTITAEDVENRYFFADVITKSEFDGYANDAACINYYVNYITTRIAYYQENGYDISWSYFLNKSPLETTLENLNPETDYVIVAFQMSPGTGEHSNKLNKAYFTTTSVQPSSNTFTITEKSGRVTIFPTNEDPYFNTVVVKGVLDGMTDQQIVSYMWNRYSEAWSMYVESGEYSYDWSSKLEMRDYTVIVFGYDGGQTTAVTKFDFTYDGGLGYKIVGDGGECTLTFSVTSKAKADDPSNSIATINVTPSTGTAHYIYRAFEGDQSATSDADIISTTFYPKVNLNKVVSDKEETTATFATEEGLTIVGLAIDADGKYGKLVRLYYAPGDKFPDYGKGGDKISVDDGDLNW